VYSAFAPVTFTRKMDARYSTVKRINEESLRRLGTDYLDLLLIHWPDETVPLADTLGALMQLVEERRVRHPGVSNFPPRLLREALDLAPVLTDQVEYHPFLGQEELLAMCADRDCLLTAYAPLGHGKVPRDETLTEIGRAHGKSAGQVALRWLLDQERVLAVPKSSSEKRRRENFEVFDFELTEQDRARIDALPKDRREFDPGWAPEWED
jgi:2,5-diketo-D-gluconate reductase B